MFICFFLFLNLFFFVSHSFLVSLIVSSAFFFVSHSSLVSLSVSSAFFFYLSFVSCFFIYLLCIFLLSFVSRFFVYLFIASKTSRFQESVPEELAGARIQLYVYLRKGHLALTHVLGNTTESRVMRRGKRRCLFVAFPLGGEGLGRL